MENERVGGETGGTGGNDMGEKRSGSPKVGYYPHVRNPEKYPDCRTDLIGGHGNTNVCPAGKHPHAATDRPLPY